MEPPIRCPAFPGPLSCFDRIGDNVAFATDSAALPRAGGPSRRSRSRPGVGSSAVNVLVIGSGAREHALCRALSLDSTVTALACAPGNAGIAELAEVHPVDATDPVAVT